MLDRYVRLVTFTPLERDQQRAWLRCVRRSAPDGVVIAVPEIDNDGEPQTVVLVGQEMEDGRHGYCVPVSRDLAEHEVARIAQAFAIGHKNLDFDVDTHQTAVALPDQQSIPMAQQELLTLATEIAKQRHLAWMRERQDAGWRYGTKVSANDKTHPLIRPWDQLPERYRKPDLAAPQKVFDLLRDLGMAVMDRDVVLDILGRS